jgi:hypothetical protein
MIEGHIEKFAGGGRATDRQRCERGQHRGLQKRRLSIVTSLLIPNQNVKSQPILSHILFYK